MACESCGVQNNDPICITVGEDRTLVVTAMQDGALYDATNAKIYLTVKKSWKDSTPLFTKRSANAGGSDSEALVITPQTGDNKGRIEVYLSAADTIKMTPLLEYVLDCWLVTTAGKHAVLIKLHTIIGGPRVSAVPIP